MSRKSRASWRSTIVKLKRKLKRKRECCSLKKEVRISHLIARNSQIKVMKVQNKWASSYWIMFLIMTIKNSSNLLSNLSATISLYFRKAKSLLKKEFNLTKEDSNITLSASWKLILQNLGNIKTFKASHNNKMNIFWANCPIIACRYLLKIKTKVI